MSNSASPVAYLPIDGWPHYRVGDDGSIWSDHFRGTLKVSEANAILIRNEVDAGRKSLRAIARDFGTTVGTVRRIRDGSHVRRWHLVKPWPQKSGHLCIYLCAGDGRKKACRVHRLILEAFVGPCPNGLECCHEDGNPANCRLGNLRWDTRKNNHADKNKHGTMLRGEKAPWSKLTEEKVREIRRLYSTGKHPQTAIAAMFGIEQSSVSGIIRRTRWAHVA